MAYRPKWPSLRAQALQVFHSAHALAGLGVDVTVAFHPGDGDLWEWFGMRPVAGLTLRALPPGGTAQSLAVRAWMLEWGDCGPGVVLAREKKLAAFALRWLEQPVVVEAHEVDSLQGRPHQLALERHVLSGAAGLITNCEGVMNGLRWMHDVPALARVIHNACRPPIRRPRGSGTVYAGSLLADKDVETLARAAPRLGGVTVLGDHEPARVAQLQRLAEGHLQVGGGVAPAQLQERLAEFETGLLPLGTGWFGRELTSPLKAFAYGGAGLPVVGADTPALRRALGEGFEPWRPGDVDSLVAANRRAQNRWDELRARPVRTWDARAHDVLSVLREVQ